jgi:hypothetical protein
MPKIQKIPAPPISARPLRLVGQRSLRSCMLWQRTAVLDVQIRPHNPEVDPNQSLLDIYGLFNSMWSFEGRRCVGDLRK